MHYHFKDEICVAEIPYTTKKFMNSFGCRGYDPYDAFISKGYYQKTLLYKSVKQELF